MIRLGDLFDIEYGRSKFNKNNLSVDGITPLVSSTGNNNGVWGYGNLEPEYKNVISVPRTGSICEAHYQGIDCCINDNCLVMIPKEQFLEREMIYFTFLVKQEKYKYVYGRQVTPKRLGETQIPDEIPSWVYEVEIPDYSNVTKSYLDEPTPALNVEEWKEFRLDELFEIEVGKGPSSKFANKNAGNTPFVSATENNNGVTNFTSHEPTHERNTITVSRNGSIGESFYQPVPFCATADVAVLNPRFNNNQYISLFIATILKQEKYKYNYGRKWNLKRMKETIIRLPSTPEGNPDWEWMEKYMKTLRWSREVK